MLGNFCALSTGSGGISGTELRLRRPEPDPWSREADILSVAEKLHLRLRLLTGEIPTSTPFLDITELPVTRLEDMSKALTPTDLASSS